MSQQGNARVNYFDQQILRLSDLTDEQAYHIAMRRRHNLAGHIWGIIYGLYLDINPDEGVPSVSAGLALDGYGREVILPFYMNISDRMFDDKNSDSLDVYLVYAREKSEPLPQGFPPCKPEGTMYRSLEMGQLRFVRAESDLVTDPQGPLPERRQPPEVPIDDLRPDPTRTPPDEVSKEWPIFLGKVTRQRDQEPRYLLDQSGRPYAGLIGESIRAPSGRAWVQLGPDGNQSGNANDNVFAVYLPTTPGEESRPRLAIDRNGNLNLRADSTVHGDLVVDGGAVEFGVGPAYEHAKPWGIYHTEVSEPNTVAGQPAEIRDELRIEMGDTDQAPARERVSIGHWSKEESKWVPCMNISSDCGIEIFGDLIAKTIKARVETDAQARAIVRRDLVVDQDKLEQAMDALRTTQPYKPGAFTSYEFGRLLQGKDDVSPILAILLDRLQEDFIQGGNLVVKNMARIVRSRGLQQVLEAVLRPIPDGPAELPEGRFVVADPNRAKDMIGGILTPLSREEREQIIAELAGAAPPAPAEEVQPEATETPPLPTAETDQPAAPEVAEGEIDQPSDEESAQTESAQPTPTVPPAPPQDVPSEEQKTSPPPAREAPKAKRKSKRKPPEKKD
jgi:hypothetical protein